MRYQPRTYHVTIKLSLSRHHYNYADHHALSHEYFIFEDMTTEHLQNVKFINQLY